MVVEEREARSLEAKAVVGEGEVRWSEAKEELLSWGALGVEGAHCS